MFYQAADQKHQDQIDQLMLSLGKFVVEFERVCAAVRNLIVFTFHREGLKNQALSQVIIGDKAAAELRTTFGALFEELANQDKEDKKVVQSLLGRFDKLSSVRNNLLHSEWYLGNEAGDKELEAIIVKFRTKQTKGAECRQKPITPTLIDKYAIEARKQLVLFNRLSTSIVQNGIKVSVHLDHSECNVEDGLPGITSQ